MSNFIESSSGRIASLVQSIGANFDPEVLSLPGGSLIAVALWAYGTARVSIARAANRGMAGHGAAPQDRPPTLDKPVPGPMHKPPVGCVACCGRP